MIPFLDCLVTRENNTLRTTVYRTPTRTNRRLIYQMSFNPTSHEAATTVQTLTRRVQIVCDSHDSLTDEIKRFNTVFTKSKYSTDFSRTHYLRQTERKSLTTHTPLQALYLTYEGPPKP